MADTIIDAYRAELNQRINDKSHALGHGSAKSWEDYKRKQGVIEGLEDSLLVFGDLIKKYIDEEDV